MSALRPGRFHVKFEHTKFGTVAEAVVDANNQLAAIPRAARQCRLKCKRKGGTWHLWHTDTLDRSASCYSIRQIIPLTTHADNGWQHHYPRP